MKRTISNLIKGMKVTGFSNEEEAITEIPIGKKHVVPIVKTDSGNTRMKSTLSIGDSSSQGQD
jgi:hypothetical protein